MDKGQGLSPTLTPWALGCRIPKPQLGALSSWALVSHWMSGGVAAEAVGAGALRGRQRGREEGEHRRRKGRGLASALGDKVFCYGGESGQPPRGH